MSSSRRYTYLYTHTHTHIHTQTYTDRERVCVCEGVCVCVWVDVWWRKEGGRKWGQLVWYVCVYVCVCT